MVRWPWKGIVVGPLSRINGSVYQDVGGHPIADLPLSWAVTQPVRAGQTPLIVVTDEAPGYEMPLSVETGHRHDEILKLVASMWNKRESKAVISAAVRDLATRFVEPMDTQRLMHEIDEAYSTADKKWETPGGGARETVTTVTSDEIVIDPLAIESHLERPEPLISILYPHLWEYPCS